MSRLTPVIELAKLRAWGATIWDPMCLTGEAGREDAYDSFLLGAFGRLRAGQSQAEVIDYLVEAELGLRGVRQVSGAAYTARVLVERLSEYAQSLPEGPVTVEPVPEFSRIRGAPTEG